MYHHHTANRISRHSGYGPKGNEVLQYFAPHLRTEVTDRHITLIREAFPDRDDLPTRENYVVVVPLKDHLRAATGQSHHLHKEGSWTAETRRCTDGSLVCRSGTHGDNWWTVLDATM